MRNRLRAVGLRRRRPLRVPILTARHIQAILLWTRRLTRADWAKVLFVDERGITLRGSDIRARVYRHRGESNNANCLVEWDDLGGGSIMLWAGVSMFTKTQIVPIHENMKAMRYQNYVIRLVLLPHICANRGMMFAQDNTPCHEIHRQCL